MKVDVKSEYLKVVDGRDDFESESAGEFEGLQSLQPHSREEGDGRLWEISETMNHSGLSLNQRLSRFIKV